MGNIVMILSLLQAITTETVKPPAVTTNVVILKNIAEGMSKKELVEAFGKPSRIESIHNFYSGEDVSRFYYDNAPCAFQSKSCSIDVAAGNVVAIHDVKAELVTSVD